MSQKIVKKPTVCGVYGCSEKHTRFIQAPKSSNVAKSSSNESVADQSSPSTAITKDNYAIDACTDVHMPIVAVNVDECYDTCALLDPASSSTFCTRALAERLSLHGRDVNYVLNTLGASGEMKSEVVSLKLSSPDGMESLYLPCVYVVDSIAVKPLSVDVQSYPYLRDLPLVQGNERAQILIGQDNSEALLPLEVKRGARGQTIRC